ncbi:MAG TPA: Dabb family protein [Aeromicrobium sp.]|nr:Dabb family protein [Aeromicrobium sp.]
MPVLRHVILFRLREGADAETAIRLLRDSRPEGALKWVVERSLDERKGVVIIEDTTFADAEALQSFRDSEAHQKSSDFLREWADWVVGDWWE